NSVIHTDDLEINATAVRLQYRGRVDFDSKVNARVEAELLRDMPVIGRLFSIALSPLTKIFEYKVTGTLGDPKPEPVWFLPKLLLVPLQPFKTLRDIFPSETNAPPVTPAPVPTAPAPAPPSTP